MGMYTEFVCAVKLEKNVDENVVVILDSMVNNRNWELTQNIIDENFEDEEFFKCDRWKWLFTSDSYYFNGITNTIFKLDDISKTYFLTIRSNLKNYDGEIDKFLKWIKPYITRYDDFIGYKQYEEIDEPDLIYISKI